MLQDYEDLLPLGSVVCLTGSSKRFLIIGQWREDPITKSVRDYLAVPYPEGEMGLPEFHEYFDHEQISTTYFTGYAERERDSYLSKLEQVLRGRPKRPARHMLKDFLNGRKRVS